MLNNICIIPARGGSKRIPRKNIVNLGGKPLLAYTIKAAIESGCFNEIIVSTEDDEIQRIAVGLGVRVDKRPVELSGDKVTKDQLITEFLRRNQFNEGLITCLLPTCAFRTSRHIQNAMKMGKDSQFEYPVISVKPYDFPIDFALTKLKNKELMHCDVKAAYDNTVSQSKETKYHPNGALYIKSIKQFLRDESFVSDAFLGFEMTEIESWDIDYPWQLEIARHIIENRINA